MKEISRLHQTDRGSDRGFNDNSKRTFADLEVECPECGAPKHRQTDGVFECYNIDEIEKDRKCVFRLKKHIASHELSEDEARQLIETKKVGPIDSFKSRFGQPFAAELLLGKEKRTWKVSFKFEGEEEHEKEINNLQEEQVICEARILDDSDEMVKVYETGRAFLRPQWRRQPVNGACESRRQS